MGRLRSGGLLGDPRKFRAIVEVEMGKRALELETVSPDGRVDNGVNQERGEGGRFTSTTDSPRCEGNPQVSHAKQERLRAILRAPEVIQNLYR